MPGNGIFLFFLLLSISTNCLLMTFTVLLHFPSSLRCLYSEYPLLMVSLFTLSTLTCVHYFSVPSRQALTLLIAGFKAFVFLMLPYTFFGITTVSTKNSLLVHVFFAPDMIFIEGQYCNFMTNNLTYKANIIRRIKTFIIFFLIRKFPFSVE